MAEVMVGNQGTTTTGNAPAVETPKQEIPLVQRVSQYKPEPPKAPEAPKVETPSLSDTFDVKEIQAIRDPIARASAERAYKSFQSDYTKKTQALAEERNRLATEKADLEAKSKQANQKPVWTKEKIQAELLSDPTFVSEARLLAQANPVPENPKASGLSDDQWSALTPEEKAKFNLMEQKLNELESQNKRSQEEAQKSFIQQQHLELKNKFANYDSSIVDKTVGDLIAGNLIIGHEQIWKALDYESAVNRAYEMGRADAANRAREVNGNRSFEGSGQAHGQRVALEPEKNEGGIAFFKRLAVARLAENKK